jgi:hypothetical protein
LNARNGLVRVCEGRVCSNVAGKRSARRLSCAAFAGKGGLGGVVFEVRVGRKLARRSGMLMFGGDNKVSSRQEEGSTMNCSCSKGRCRGVVVFVNCWKGECSQRQQLVHQLLCAYQGRDSQTHFKQRAFRRLTTHPAASSLAASRLVIYAQPLANRTAYQEYIFTFGSSDAASPLSQCARSTTSTKLSTWRCWGVSCHDNDRRLERLVVGIGAKGLSITVG